MSDQNRRPDIVGEADRAEALILEPVARAGGLPRYVLMPGDPDRVAIMAEQWDDVTDYPLVRGYRAATGRFQGHPIAAVSSGLGAPSMEMLFSEAVQCGADTVIRVGTTGSLHAEVGNGELIINDASVRLDGASEQYVRPGFPAAASHEVTAALVAASQELGASFHVGTGATTASFYAGQDRANPAGFERPDRGALIEELTAARVLNFDMEGATLFTLARLFGVRAGMVSTVIANRVSGEWGDRGGTAVACLATATAVRLLADAEQE